MSLPLSREETAPPPFPASQKTISVLNINMLYTFYSAIPVSPENAPFPSAPHGPVGGGVILHRLFPGEKKYI